MQPLVRDPLQGFDILDVYPATLKFHGPGLLQQGKGLGHSLALGADHGCHLSVGVAGGYLVTFSRQHSLALNELEDEARQAGGDILEGYVFHTVFCEEEAFTQDAHHFQADLGPVHHQPLEIQPPHLADGDRFHSLRVRVLKPLGSERHLSEHRPGSHDRKGELPPIRTHTVDSHPPLLEHEEHLATLLRGVEDLGPLKMSVRDEDAEFLYLLARERLQDVHHREEAKLFLWRQHLCSLSSTSAKDIPRAKSVGTRRFGPLRHINTTAAFE